MMVSISQQWIDRASRDEDEEIIAAGPNVIGRSDIDIKSMFLNFCKSSAALEILRRRWLGLEGGKGLATSDLAEKIQDYLFTNRPKVANAPMFRSSKPVAADDVNRQIATYIWLIHSSTIAQKQQVGSFSNDLFSEHAVSTLVKLSADKDGPVKAKHWFREAGIAFVVNSSLPSMKLDAACTFLSSGTPMIAVTLRYDRIDNFWFTLLHELGHLKLHMEGTNGLVFLDDLDNVPENDELEAEANAFARDSLIPRDKWRRSEAFRLKSKSAILKLAHEQHVHPAIIAGRLRHETGDYTMHPELLGQDTVRDQLIAVCD